MNAPLLGLLIGILFGAASQAGRFCLLRGMKGAVGGNDLSALRAFGIAMAVAILTTQIMAANGATDLAASLPMRPRYSVAGLLSGGAIFGIGMVLANACGARAVVLAVGGNLRAGLAVIALAVAAQASQTGVLAPLRNWVQGFAVVEPAALSLPDLLAGAGLGAGLATFLATGLPVLLLLGLGLPLLRERPREAALAAVIGLAVAAGWWATHITNDPFDPRILTSISFVGPMGDGLLWLMLSTGRALGFGVTVIAGTAMGAFAMARISGGFRLHLPESPGSAMRAVAGGIAMGFGGVLALGCSVGQGLSGISTLSLASLVAFLGIVSGIAIGLAVKRQSERTPS